MWLRVGLLISAIPKGQGLNQDSEKQKSSSPPIPVGGGGGVDTNECCIRYVDDGKQ